MAFDKVEKSGRGGGSSEPMISLRKSGGIGINSAAIEEYLDGEEYAELFFDEEDEDDNRLGIKPVTEAGDDAFKINLTESSGGITPTNFMNRNRLVPEITTRYKAEWDEDEEMLITDLDEDEIGTYGSPRDEDDEE